MPRVNAPVAEPLRILPNPVTRFYPGGARISEFRGHPAGEVAPEDWVGSATEAWDLRNERAGEGLASVAVGTGVARLVDLIDADPEAWLGRAHARQVGSSPGVLVKLLDADARLPVHCHPSRAFAQDVLGSAFGKAECWIILETREATGTVHLGFSKSISRPTLRGWIDDQDATALLGALCELTVRAGDVIFVPAGLPHAIGAGIFMVEVQEPTDFSIVAERRGFPIRDDDARLGREWDVVVDAFDRQGLRASELEALRQVATETQRDSAMTRRRLTGAVADPYFRVDRAQISGRASLRMEGFAVVLVLHGAGELSVGHRRVGASTGNAFVVPAACSENLTAEGDIELLLCEPPEPRLLPRGRAA